MKTWIAVGIALIVPSCAIAQKTFTVDLTNQRTVQIDRWKNPKCANVFEGWADGAISGGERGQLQLAVTDLSSHSFRQGDEIGITLSLKNVGKRPTTIPWSPDPLTVVNSPQILKEGYFIASFSVWLRTEDVSSPLVATAFLYSSDDKPWSSLELQPGDQANIRIKATVKSSYPHGQDFKPTKTGQLRASLYQWQQSKTEGPNCNIMNGAFAYRKLESGRIVVELQGSS
ncbi:MAG TPA: hypothetical protein VLA96_11140 [Terriglobales bacterium]|nr:hypothetical protein [Terriglobales bacterium]